MQAFLLDKEGKTEFVGNRTECALLVLLRDWGQDFKAMRDEHSGRIEHMYGFSSERKMASVLMKTKSGTRLYVKVSFCRSRQDLRKVSKVLKPALNHGNCILKDTSLSCQRGRHCNVFCNGSNCVSCFLVCA